MPVRKTLWNLTSGPALEGWGQGKGELVAQALAKPAQSDTHPFAARQMATRNNSSTGCSSKIANTVLFSAEFNA